MAFGSHIKKITNGLRWAPEQLVKQPVYAKPVNQIYPISSIRYSPEEIKRISSATPAQMLNKI